MYYTITVAVIANTDRQIEVGEAVERKRIWEEMKKHGVLSPSNFLHSSQGDRKETFSTLLVSTLLCF